MTAYWVARAKINDPVAYKKYTDRVPAILEKYHGRVLARGGDYRTGRRRDLKRGRNHGCRGGS